ncbi:MAG: DNA repair protein RecN [Limnochordales bacterium]|nr:DNA repair protein RecN [Limnochordales bacterium]
MLTELHIRNFALIEEVSLNFGPGLTVLTGETGAGKSIIVDALLLALGGRGGSEQIREGASALLVEAVFDLSRAIPEEALDGQIPPTGLAACWRLLSDLDLLDADDPETVVLAREILASGRSRCRINGRLVPLRVLGQIGATLVEWLGQHEHQSLLQHEVQRALLDRFGGEELLAEARTVYRLYQELSRAAEELNRLQMAEAARERELDRLRYEMGEIDAAGLREGEDEELLREEKRLQHAARLLEAANRAYALIYEGGEGGREAAPASDALSLVGQAVSLLETASRLDGEVRPVLQLLQSVEEGLTEAASALRRYREGLSTDPERLELVTSRLDLIRRLGRKYGNGVAAILNYRREIEARIAELERSAARVEELGQQVARLQEALVQAAARLTALRQRAAARLSAELPAKLSKVALEQARFEVRLLPLEKAPSPAVGVPVGPYGAEQVEFRFSANPGISPEPLAKVASGGELSRVSLALKTILAAADATPVLVFDEVEAGVGGRTVLRLAEVLIELARHHQVLCITHAPIVAAQAQAQWVVEKVVSDGRTHVRVRQVEGEERLREIARMLGGDADAAVVREYARRLLGHQEASAATQ